LTASTTNDAVSPEAGLKRLAARFYCEWLKGLDLEDQGSMVLLHGFMKKTQKAPRQDIDLALKRKKGTGT
jgi:phage-related protein